MSTYINNNINLDGFTSIWYNNLPKVLGTKFI
jgi:hypothetical protein